MSQSAMTLQRVDDFQRDARPLIEEQRLLARVRDGEEAAFARLFERHWDAVRGVLVRLTGDPEVASDVTQEVFVQLYRKPPVGEDVPLRAWLYRVALNRGYNALRADRRRRSREETVAHDPGVTPQTGATEPDALERGASLAEERDAVRRALVRLPERQRDCLVLRAEGSSYAEIAAAVGIAQGSVGTILARAERAFKAEFLARRGGL